MLSFSSVWRRENDKSWAARTIMILSALPVFIGSFVLHDELIYVNAFHGRKTKILHGSPFHLVDNKSLRAHLTSGWEEIQFRLFMFIFASHFFVFFSKIERINLYRTERRERAGVVLFSFLSFLEKLHLRRKDSKHISQ